MSTSNISLITNSVFISKDEMSRSNISLITNSVFNSENIKKI